MREELLKLIQDLRRTHATHTGNLDQLEAKIELQNGMLRGMEEKMRVMVQLIRAYDLQGDRLIMRIEISELRSQLQEWGAL